MLRPPEWPYWSLLDRFVYMALVALFMTLVTIGATDVVHWGARALFGV